MGQAKARGTFEQRKAEAIERNEAAQRKREAAENKALIERPKRIGFNRTQRRLGRSMLTASFLGLAASAINLTESKKPEKG